MLLLLPLLALYIRVQRRRRDLIARYGSMGLVQAGGRAPGWRRHLPSVLFLLALALLLFALARPQTTVSLPRVEGIVILAFDVSGSMAADDLKPTRMEAAKVAARAFVQRQPPTVQIGVVSFSDGGIEVQPPTNDQAQILAAINRLAPARGTSLSNGILASLNAITTANGRQAPSLYTNRTPAPTAVPTVVPKGTYTPRRDHPAHRWREYRAARPERGGGGGGRSRGADLPGRDRQPERGTAEDRGVQRADTPR